MKHSRVLAMAAAVLAAASIAEAACDFDVVVKASGLRTSMVRAFAACSSSELPSANTKTSGGQPACEPVTPRKDSGGLGQPSKYAFGALGDCTLQVAAKLEADCSRVTDPATKAAVGGGALPAAPCHVQYVGYRQHRCRVVRGVRCLSSVAHLHPDRTDRRHHL